jgi:hypothetical protein
MEELACRAAATFGKWPHEFDGLDEDQRVRACAYLELVEFRKARRSELEAEAVKEAVAEQERNSQSAKESWKKTWPKTVGRR